VSENSCSSFSFTRMIRKVSTYTSIAGLTFSGLRHRHDIADWLRTSYDRKEILKDFDRLQVPKVSADSSSTAEPSRQTPSESRAAPKAASTESPRSNAPESVTSGSTPQNQPAASASSGSQVVQPQEVSAEVPRDRHTDTAAANSEKTPKQISPQQSRNIDVTPPKPYAAQREEFASLRQQLEVFSGRNAEVLPVEAVYAKNWLVDVEKGLAELSSKGAHVALDEGARNTLLAVTDALSKASEWTKRAVEDEAEAQKLGRDLKHSDFLRLAEASLAESSSKSDLIQGIRYAKATRLDGCFKADAAALLGALYHRLGRHDEAELELSRTIKYTKNGHSGSSGKPETRHRDRKAAFDARMLLGRMYLESRDSAKSTQVGSMFLDAKRFAEASDEYKQLGDELLRCGQKSEALHSWGEALIKSQALNQDLWSKFCSIGSESGNEAHFIEVVKKCSAEANPYSGVAQGVLISLELRKLQGLAQELGTRITEFGKGSEAPLPAEIVIAQQAFKDWDSGFKALFEQSETGSSKSNVSRESVERCKTSLGVIQEKVERAVEQDSLLRSVWEGSDEAQLRKKATDLIRSGDEAKAKTAILYLKALRARRDDPVYSNNLGVAYKSIGQLEAARIELLRAVVVEPVGKPGFYSNLLDCCERSVGKGQDSNYVVVKARYLSDAAAGNLFMACYAAANYYADKSPQRAKEWLQIAAQEINAGRTAKVPSEFTTDCAARLDATTGASPVRRDRAVNSNGSSKQEGRGVPSNGSNSIPSRGRVPIHHYYFFE